MMRKFTILATNTKNFSKSSLSSRIICNRALTNNLRYFSTEKNNGDGKEEPQLEEDQVFAESPNNDSVIKDLQKEVRELKEKLLRSYAEEENVRRIAKRDVDNAKNYANSSFAKALLDVADDLERALSSVPKEKLAEDSTLKTLHEGVEMTEKSLQKVFIQFKVQKYGEIGEKFDPSLHDALFQIPDATKENGTIVQILKKGYKLSERVIRAAQVGTTSNPSQ